MNENSAFEFSQLKMNPIILLTLCPNAFFVCPRPNHVIRQSCSKASLYEWLCYWDVNKIKAFYVSVSFINLDMQYQLYRESYKINRFVDFNINLHQDSLFSINEHPGQRYKETVLSGRQILQIVV